MVFMLRDSILYPNAARTARQITNYIYSYSSGAHEKPSTTVDGPQNNTQGESAERLWNDTKLRHIRNLRKEAGTSNSEESFLPFVRTVIIDMTRVTHVDTTGMQALADIRSALKDWAGTDAELTFVGLNNRVKERFQRAESCFDESSGEGEPRDGGYIVFDALQTVLYSPHSEDVKRTQNE